MGNGGGGGVIRPTKFDHIRYDHVGTLTKKTGNAANNRRLSGIPESSPMGVADVHGAKQMRHAVIRRHQSMYIHPRATTDIHQNAALHLPYKMHEVSGKSEVRPIVTLQRSKTTVGAASSSSTPLHYRSTPIRQMQQPRTTFSKYQSDYNTIHYAGRKPKYSPATEELCEFQAGHLDVGSNQIIFNRVILE